MGLISDADQGVAQVSSGLPQGVAGRVLPRDPGEQGLQRTRTAEALQITDQGQGTIVGPAPAQGDIRIELKHHHHSSLLTAETLQLNIALGAEPHRTEASLQQIGIPKNCWQDGEMGHGHHDREP